MYEISQPFWAPFQVGIITIRRHIQCALSDKGLGIRWHILEIVHNYKHLYYGAKWIKQSYLYSSRFGHIVALFTEVDMTLKDKIYFIYNTFKFSRKERKNALNLGEYFKILMLLIIRRIFCSPKVDSELLM